MQLKNISKTYKNKSGIVKALDDISLDIRYNSLYVIYGASGSGKSTLLDIIARNDKDYEGKYEDHDKIVSLIRSYDERAEIINPLYDERTAIRNESRIYDLLFTIAIFVITLAIIVYTAVFNDREARHFKRMAALIGSFDVKAGVLNDIYIGIRSKIISISASVMIIPLMIFCLSSFSDLLVLLIMIMIVIITQIITLYSLKKSALSALNISRTLKDHGFG